MEQAWIAGEPATLEAAIVEAAALLASSRHPLIAGLGTDIAGARAAVTLAQQIGAFVDHMHADALLRNLDVMRSSGVVLTTPDEADVRADTLLLIGPGFDGASPELPARLFGPMRRRQADADIERRVFCLCPGRDLAIPSSGEKAAAVVGAQPRQLPALLAALRARIAGRPIADSPVSSRKLDEVATGLKGARYGVAIWSAAALDALTIEMLCDLVDDLNATTRFAGLPLVPGDNAVGVMQACAWLTGAPMRSGFGRGAPQHDPWLFDGRRLVASGETDCVIWISAYSAAPPTWRRALPTIALTGGKAKFQAAPSVHIAVGRPGVDHDGVAHLSSIGTLALAQAQAPSEAISVADAITRIAAILPAAGVGTC
jgi:formylmethanofuran dehydrogenase subunit B